MNRHYTNLQLISNNYSDSNEYKYLYISETQSLISFLTVHKYLLQDLRTLTTRERPEDHHRSTPTLQYKPDEDGDPTNITEEPETSDKRPI